MIEVTMKSQPENVALACASVKKAASDAGMTEQAIMELELAVSEAVTNSIEHAYQWQENQEIVLKIQISSTQISVTVLDRGTPVPASLFNNIDSSFDELGDASALLAESGRGLKIISALVDEIKVCRHEGWNSLTLIKQV